MDIKYCENGTLVLKSGTASMLINPENNKTKVQKYPESIVIDLTSKIEKSRCEKYLVQNPGEYEMDDIHVMFRILEDGGQVVLANIGGIDVCYLENNVEKLEKDIVDEIISMGVLIVSLRGEGKLRSDMVSDMVGEMTPRYLLPIFQGEQEKENFQKVFGIQEFVIEKKLKLDKSNMGDDESPVEIVLLSI